MQTRVAFREELNRLEGLALGTLDEIAPLLDGARDAFAIQDAGLAADVIAAGREVGRRYVLLHEGVLSLLARQAPVAGDLRLAAALLQVGKHVERMGDQCVTIARLVPSDHPRPADGELAATVLAMCAAARAQAIQARQAFALRDATLAMELTVLDERLDALGNSAFDAALALCARDDVRDWTLRVLLVARAIERIGDNAVDIGEQALYVVSGAFRELADAG
jgi:phosphate transport system protein